ncbi:MAG: thioredoxin family protein [Ardenticatenaceae bacterium]|nr:thioredoxin family protein [Ardenticatenaceae bacterium]HBY97950.1 hypothetical protein [Chloroflexota bacterium]
MVERLVVLLALTTLMILAILAWDWLRRHQVAQVIAGDEAARDRPTLLYFSGEWCAPCRYQQAPIIERLRAEMTDHVVIRAVDAVDNAELAARYGVLSVPTTVIISPSGRVVARNTGVVDDGTLRRQLARAA